MTQIMSGIHSGQDDRSNAWIFTCDRWAEADTYIQLPINPTSLELSNPLRGTSGETQGGRFMYVYRNPKSKSVFKPCNYSFEIPSGLILPEFSEDYINEAKRLAFDFGTSVMSDYSVRDGRSGMSESTDATADNIYQSRRGGANTVTLSQYRAGLRSKMESQFAERQADPKSSHIADHLAGKAFRKHDTGVSKSPNIPPLYRSDIPVTLQNLWAFMCLMDEPLTYVDSQKRIRNNRRIVHLSTLTLPSMTMYGWPDAGGLKIGEAADQPEVTLSFDLFITATNPVMGYANFDGLAGAYKANIATQTTSLERIRAELFNGDATKTHDNNNLGVLRR